MNENEIRELHKFKEEIQEPMENFNLDRIIKQRALLKIYSTMLELRTEMMRMKKALDKLKMEVKSRKL